MFNPKVPEGHQFMKQNLIMSTAYNVLMDEGYRPQRMKPIPEETCLLFKSQGYPLMIVSDGDDMINISTLIKTSYTKDFGRLDLYELVNGINCMRVEKVEFADNKKILIALISFQSLVLETKDIKNAWVRY